MPARKPSRPAPTTLRAWREHVRLTLAEVAERLGTTQSTVSKWERGRTPVNLEILRDLAAIFGISPASLLFMPGEQGKADLLEQALRIVEAGDRDNLNAWLDLGARMFGVDGLPSRPPPETPTPSGETDEATRPTRHAPRRAPRKRYHDQNPGRSVPAR